LFLTTPQNRSIRKLRSGSPKVVALLFSDSAERVRT